MKIMIPYNKAYSTDKEIEYVNDAIKQGCLSGDGHYTRLVEEFISSRLMSGKVHMTTSATHALETVCESNYHIFYVLFNAEKTRDTVRGKLYGRGITALTHFVPLHSSAMGRSLGYAEGDLQRTEAVGKRLLRLPIYTGMSDSEMNYIGEQLTDILEEL